MVPLNKTGTKGNAFLLDSKERIVPFVPFLLDIVGHAQTCVNMLRYVQTCPVMPRHVQTCPGMPKHAQTCPGKLRHAQTCPDMPKQVNGSALGCFP